MRSFLNNLVSEASGRWVLNEQRKLLSHVNLGQVESCVELVPELLEEWLGGELAHLDVKVNGLEDSVANLLGWSIFDVAELAKGVLVHEEVEVLLFQNSFHLISISLIKFSILDSLLDGRIQLENSVDAPDSLEVGFLWERFWNLVREDHHIGVRREHFWCHGFELVQMSGEPVSFLFNSGVKT